jgi:Na+/H+-dicarboxylate symporter/ABC-type amino acid transport substrate-binding protein
MKRMSFTAKILWGLAAGIFTGLFLGERAAILKWAADGFVKLLQMTVLPYVTISIISGLGTLRPEQVHRLGRRAAVVVAGLWGVALVFAFLIPLTFPHVPNASFFSTTLVEQTPSFNFVDLYIPANPFYSLANNVVPAVVLFSVVVGVALIGIDRKQPLIDMLMVAGQALSKTTQYIVRLAPYGLFAIAANASGTLSLEELGRLQVYLIAYVVVALLVALWVLPGLVSALTPIRASDIFRLTKEALITAFVAGDLFIVLPVLIEASKTLLAERVPSDRNAATLPEVIVPVSFNFPHTGKLLSLSFVLFAGWFADHVVSVSAYPKLALTGLLTLFGSTTVAIPFLLDLFRIPADTFQLFVASGVINSRVGSLVAAVHTVAVSLLAACAVTGSLVWNRRRLTRYVVVTLALTLVLVGGTRILFATFLRPVYSKDKILAGMHLLHDPVSHVVLRTTPEPGAANQPASRLEAIRARGALRVGYFEETLPFAFVNERGDLVGFDIDMANRLAAELGVGLEFMPVARDRFDEAMADGGCDIMMSGVVVTPLRASRILFSNSYMQETMAFLVPDDVRDRFETWDQIRAMEHVRIAVLDIPYYKAKLLEHVPNATLVVIKEFKDVRALLATRSADVDAFAIPAERGSAWTLIYPDYSVVVPEPLSLKLPLAYPIARHDQSFASFVNSWIDLKRQDGTLDAVYKYWILGQNAAPHQPRWSIMRNVLHWTK